MAGICVLDGRSLKEESGVQVVEVNVNNVNSPILHVDGWQLVMSKIDGRRVP